jgi:hypothetical protein
LVYLQLTLNVLLKVQCTQKKQYVLLNRMWFVVTSKRTVLCGELQVLVDSRWSIATCKI